MPIHGPRKNTNRQRNEALDRELSNFDKMLEDWVRDVHPHRYDLHFPDYSCCHPKLKAADKDKAKFYSALKVLDIPTIEALRQQFEGAYWAYKEETCGKEIN